MTEDQMLIIAALGAMALRHDEWAKLEEAKRNTDNERWLYHRRMANKYDNLKERLIAQYNNPAAT